MCVRGLKLEECDKQCVRLCNCTCVHVCMCACVHVYMCTCVHVCVFVCMSVCVREGSSLRSATSSVLGVTYDPEYNVVYVCV